MLKTFSSIFSFRKTSLRQPHSRSGLCRLMLLVSCYSSIEPSTVEKLKNGSLPTMMSMKLWFYVRLSFIRAPPLTHKLQVIGSVLYSGALGLWFTPISTHQCFELGPSNWKACELPLCHQLPSRVTRVTEVSLFRYRLESHTLLASNCEIHIEIRLLKPRWITVDGMWQISSETEG